jgi:hypothetical protein
MGKYDYADRAFAGKPWFTKSHYPTRHRNYNKRFMSKLLFIQNAYAYFRG